MLKKYPDNAEILVLMGQTKLAQNKKEDAIESYKDAITKQPKDPNGYNRFLIFTFGKKIITPRPMSFRRPCASSQTI